MKATFEFILPEDRKDFEIHSKSIDLYLAIGDIVEHFRHIDKYGEKKARTIKVEDVRKTIYDILKERDVDTLWS